ncbi:MAG: pyruvate ferredoxin oxidoreductase [Prevotella sp.]|nr:pyruvate ferredoxin oxidoreductase [Prevotella sp.]
MDYKYIEQLLERYWQGKTTLQEEGILRTFFSQPDIPEDLRKYRELFTIEREEPLGDDFDARILAMIDDESQEPQQQAKIVTMVSRLKPLFKAAAIVAIILTLGNAAQAPWNYGWDNPKDEYAKFHQEQQDSINILSPIQAENVIDTILTPKDESSKLYE